MAQVLGIANGKRILLSFGQKTDSAIEESFFCLSIDGEWNLDSNSDRIQNVKALKNLTNSKVTKAHITEKRLLICFSEDTGDRSDFPPLTIGDVWTGAIQIL